MFLRIRWRRTLVCALIVLVTFAVFTYVPFSDLIGLRKETSVHFLAIIIPFRDAYDELQQFVPYMSQFLANQSVQHEFFLINQVDENRFNRASLINVGYLHAKNDPRFDYLAMHDVDLLPLNPELKYKYPGNGNVLHIADPRLHPYYNYPDFVGGILLVTMTDFRRLNGLSNKYWGWGKEDDDFYRRIHRNRLTVLRPDSVTTGTENTFKDLHTKLRERDHGRCLNQASNLEAEDSSSGIHDIHYQIESMDILSIDGSSPVTVLNVKLTCNPKVTPWCRCD